MVVLPNLTSFRLVRSFYQLNLVKMTVGQNWIFSKMTIFLSICDIFLIYCYSAIKLA